MSVCPARSDLPAIVKAMLVVLLAGPLAAQDAGTPADAPTPRNPLEAQAEAEAEEADRRAARLAAVAAEVARLAAEREAVRQATLEAEAQAARAAAVAAAQAAAAAQADAMAAAAAEAEARRAVVAAEVARLAAEREAAREAARQADAAVAACMEIAGPPSAEVPLSAAGQSAIFARLRAALAPCEEAVRLSPEAGGPLFHLATVAQARGAHREAVALYERAAAASIGPAYTRLGDYYNFGIGPIRPDLDRAIAAYRAATDLGDPAGMATLGFMVRLGRGVPRDTAEMVRLFRTAADTGYHFAQLTLAQVYLTGEGVPGGVDAALGIPDARIAVPLLAAAARAGNLEAALTLTRVYAVGAEGVPPNPAARLRWTGRAADAGHPPAIAALAYLREQGIGTVPDPEAAAQGYVAALATGGVAVADLRAEGGARPPPWDRQTAIAFQRLLQERGLYAGPLDGIVGPGTLGAARALAE